MPISNPAAGILTYGTTTIASNVLRNSNDAEKTTVSGTYVKLKETKLNQDLPACRLKFELTCGDGGKARVYKNGVAEGIEQSKSGAYGIFSEDFAGWVENDLIQLYCLSATGPLAKVRNMRFYYGVDLKPFSVTNQDP